MTVKALKKKNNMSGPFKMKGSPMARNFGIGASPVRNREDTLQDSDGKKVIANDNTGKVNTHYQDSMQDATDSGSFDKAFSSARKSGAKTFTYKGESFNTKLAKSTPGGKNTGKPPKSGDNKPS